MAGVHSRRAPDIRLLLACGAAVVLPLVVLAVASAVHGTETPWGDPAGIELRTRDVGHRPVLVGLWSRGDWSHPGPALFYVLALPYRLSGSSPLGLTFGALAVNGAAILGMVVLARRHGGTAMLLLTTAGILGLLWGLGPVFLRSDWNPFLPVLPFGLLLFLSWAMTCGDRWALPVAVVVASFCAQTHIGYVALGLPLVLWGAAWLVVPVVRAWRSHEPEWRARLGALARPALAAVAVAIVVWLPPLLDQVRETPGNLRRTVNYFEHSTEELATLGDGYRIVAEQFTSHPAWLERSRPIDFVGQPTVLGSTPVPVLLVPVLLAALLLWKRGPPASRRLTATLAVSAILGVVSVARTYEPLSDYRLRWANVLAMVAIVLVGWAAWVLTQRRVPRTTRPWLIGTAVAALLLASTIVAVDGAKAVVREPQSHDARLVDEFTDAITRAMPAGDGPVVVRGADDEARVFQGVFLALERRGFDVRSDERYGIVANGVDDRFWPGGPRRAFVTVAAGDHLDEALRRDEPPHLIAYEGKPPPDVRRRRLRKWASLEAAHRSGEIGDVEYFLGVAKARQGLQPAIGVLLEDGRSVRG
jgi:hypothetical protein